MYCGKPVSYVITCNHARNDDDDADDADDDDDDVDEDDADADDDDDDAAACACPRGSGVMRQAGPLPKTLASCIPSSCGALLRSGLTTPSNSRNPCRRACRYEVLVSAVGEAV